MSGVVLEVHLEQRNPMRLEGGFSAHAGEIVALVGPSGAGKTSFLRVLAGLMQPERGWVRVGDEVWLDTQRGIMLPPARRHVGMVFQNYALMPHMSALENVALAMLDRPRRERLAEAERWLAQMRLTRDQMLRPPGALSGGQQQRVAVARALARRPRLLLFDEPFSAVDQMNRQGLYELLARLREEVAVPMVLVTHDLQEARQLADRLIVLDAGCILQEGTPEQIYRKPRNARVADLVGITNRFEGIWLGPGSAEDESAARAWISWLAADGSPTMAKLRVLDKRRIAAGQRVTWVFHSDALRLEGEPLRAEAEEQLFEAVASEVRHLGEMTMAHLRVPAAGGSSIRIVRSGPLGRAIKAGETLRFWLDTSGIHVMPRRNR